MQIFVGVIQHKHGDNVYAATTRDRLMKQIADYCREWWKSDGPDEPMPEGDEDVVTQYFDWVAEIGGSEGYFIVDDTELL
jgi:hypothetical protein